MARNKKSKNKRSKKRKGKRNRQRNLKRPLCPKWIFEADVPTEDYLEDVNLNDPFELEEVVDNFVWNLEQKSFLTWEAVICEEQGLALTKKQEQALSSLICFDEETYEERILYIGERARPTEPWYEIARKIAPHVLRDPFKTYEITSAVFFEGWPNLFNAIEEHAKDLIVPSGIQNPIDVIPLEIQHKLWLQDCFGMLSGLGQEEGLDLTEQADRIEGFIERLRECQDSVEFLELSLEKMLTVLILPENDKKIFVEKFMKELGLPSQKEPIAKFL